MVEIVKDIVNTIVKKGADASSVIISNGMKEQFSILAGEITLLRTTFNISITMIAYKNGKKGTITINKKDQKTIDQAIEKLFEITNSSQKDPAHKIAPYQGVHKFYSGDKEANKGLMFDRFNNFNNFISKNYPTLMLENVNFDFNYGESFLYNSNKTEFSSEKGSYYFTAMFSSKEGDKSSSFNYSGFTTKSLDKELFEYGSISQVIKDNVGQIYTKPIGDKFIGDIIFTPNSVGDIVSSVVSMLGDYSIMTNQSIYRNSLQQKIASSKFSLYSEPLDKRVASPYFFTSDGRLIDNDTIIEDGELKTFILSIYGAEKSGEKVSKNVGGAYRVKGGEKTFQEMVKMVKRGILIDRFSGGRPNNNGDISGVAKNSYYIEDGEIKYPVSETMISGNIGKILENIKEISKESVNFGNSVFPYILSEGITISG